MLTACACRRVCKKWSTLLTRSAPPPQRESNLEDVVIDKEMEQLLAQDLSPRRRRCRCLPRIPFLGRREEEFSTDVEFESIAVTASV